MEKDQITALERVTLEKREQVVAAGEEVVAWVDVPEHNCLFRLPKVPELRWSEAPQWRAEERRWPTQEIRQHTRGPLHFLDQSRGGGLLRAAMVIGVVADIVALGRDPLYQPRVTLRALANEEECGRHVASGERVEEARCLIRIGAIIEGEANLAAPPGAMAQEEPWRKGDFH